MSRIKIVKLILLILVFSAIFAVCFFSIRIFEGFGESACRKLSRVNFALSNSKDFNAIFSIEENNSYLVTFNPTDKIVLARGFGEYEIGKIYGLGELDKKGGELLSESIQESWSIPVFGYFENDSLSEKIFLDNTSGEIKKLVKNCIFGKCKTDLKYFDLLALYLKLLKFSVNTVQTEKIGFNRKIDLLKDKKIRDEALAIEVLNSTEHIGLAERAKNLLENIGGRVVRLSETEESLDNCKIVAKPDIIKTYSFGILQQIYGCDIEKSSEGADNRADVTLILGERYWKKLSERW